MKVVHIVPVVEETIINSSASSSYISLVAPYSRPTLDKVKYHSTLKKYSHVMGWVFSSHLRAHSCASSCAVSNIQQTLISNMSTVFRKDSECRKVHFVQSKDKMSNWKTWISPEYHNYTVIMITTTLLYRASKGNSNPRNFFKKIHSISWYSRYWYSPSLTGQYSTSSYYYYYYYYSVFLV